MDFNFVPRFVSIDFVSVNKTVENNSPCLPNRVSRSFSIVVLNWYRMDVKRGFNKRRSIPSLKTLSCEVTFDGCSSIVSSRLILSEKNISLNFFKWFLSLIKSRVWKSFVNNWNNSLHQLSYCCWGFNWFNAWINSFTNGVWRSNFWRIISRLCFNIGSVIEYCNVS